MGRKRKVVQPEDGERHWQLPPCRVCDGPAGGFHYGVNTCEACKGFFHRGSTHNSHEEFHCESGGNCTVSYTLAKICKKCRYAKCLAVGMAKRAIKTGRYTVEKRTKDILEIKSLEEKGSYSWSFSNKVNSTDSSCDSNSTPQPNSLPSSDSMSSSSEAKHHPGVKPEVLIHSATVDQATPNSLLSLTSGHPHNHAAQTLAPPPSGSMNSLPITAAATHTISSSSSTTTTLPPSSTASVNSLDDSSPRQHLSLSPSPQASVHLSPELAEGLDVPSPCLPVNASRPRSSISSDLSSVSTSPCTSAGCDHCTLKADIRELYRDKDKVVETLVQARQDHIEALLPTMTAEEMRQKALEHIENCRLSEEMFGIMHRLPDQEYDRIYESTGIDADGRQERCKRWNVTMEVNIRALAKFAKCIPGFSFLDIQDQVTLIKYSRTEFLFVTGFHKVDTELGVVLCGDRKLRCRVDIGRELNADNVMERYVRQCKCFQKLKLTVEEQVIFSAIILMPPDRENTVQSEEARLIYELLNECLIYLLQKRCDRPLRLFANVISCMTMFRTFGHDSIKMFKKLRIDKYSNVTHNPLLREMLGGIFFDDMDSEEQQQQQQQQQQQGTQDTQQGASGPSHGPSIGPLAGPIASPLTDPVVPGPLPGPVMGPLTGPVTTGPIPGPLVLTSFNSDLPFGNGQHQRHDLFSPPRP